MDHPQVSCIIPTKNRAGLVSGAIDSALSQSCDSIEVIVVDDGSSDATSSVLGRFGARIRVLRTNGVGVSAARNAGLRVARGAYIALLDSDDIWYPEKVNQQLNVMRSRTELGFTFTDYTVSVPAEGGGWRVVETRRYLGEPSLRRLLERNFTGTLTIMARRDAMEEVGGFDVSLERGSDYDILLRMARWRPFARVPGVLAEYRWHRDSITGGSRKRNAEAYMDVIRRLAASDPELFSLVGADADSLLADARERIANLPESKAMNR